jgi:hypothetical protein
VRVGWSSHAATLACSCCWSRWPWWWLALLQPSAVLRLWQQRWWDPTALSACAQVKWVELCVIWSRAGCCSTALCAVPTLPVCAGKQAPCHRQTADAGAVAATERHGVELRHEIGRGVHSTVYQGTSSCRSSCQVPLLPSPVSCWLCVAYVRRCAWCYTHNCVHAAGICCKLALAIKVVRLGPSFKESHPELLKSEAKPFHHSHPSIVCPHPVGALGLADPGLPTASLAKLAS